ncbi:hypothetical protein BH23GEM10_BH23GEM10_08340 [soil metagenome]
MSGIMRMATACAAVLMLSACADQGDLDDTTLPDTLAGQPEFAAPAPDPGPAGAGMREVSVTLTEWSIGLSTQDVEAGAVAFDIRNDGTMPHTFEIEGGGEEWSTEPIEPGGSVTMSIDLPAGEYKVYCPIDSAGMNHESQGMVTQLRAN